MLSPGLNWLSASAVTLGVEIQAHMPTTPIRQLQHNSAKKLHVYSRVFFALQGSGPWDFDSSSHFPNGFMTFIMLAKVFWMLA